MMAARIDPAGAMPFLPFGTGVEPALAHALADEMVGLTALLADLACDLADNPATLRHHMHSLQAIDRITQAQLAIADLLRSSDPIERRLAAVTLEDLGGSVRDAVDRYRLHGIPDEGDLIDPS